jgi:hypothetical protein
MQPVDGDGSLTVSFDGDDQDDRRSLASGTHIKFIDGVWSVRNDPTFQPAGPFLCHLADFGLQFWQGGKVVDCRRREPGVYLYELCKELNSKIPQEQWEINPNTGKAKEPWEFVWYVHLIRMNDGGRFCHINSTTGCRIGVKEIRDNVRTLYALGKRKQNEVPLVKLSSKTFKGQMGPKLRPFFEIVDWHFFGPPPASTPVPAPKTPQIGSSVDPAKVGKPLTLAEELDDEIPELA